MARRRSKQAPLPFYGLVCKDCFEDYPKNTKLLNTQCQCSPSHKSSTVKDLIHVAVNDEDMLEKIRPLPKKSPPGKGFVLCKNADGSCYRGDKCTYAHGKAEQKAWNAQLSGSKIGSELYTCRCTYYLRALNFVSANGLAKYNHKDLVGGHHDPSQKQIEFLLINFADKVIYFHRY